MGAVTAALIAIAAVGLGWFTIEIACKPCLERGRDAIDRNLNPDYDPDDESETLGAPLNPNNNESDDPTAAASSTISKAV